MINYGLITVNTMFLPIIGMLVGLVLGIRVNAKLNIWFYLIVGVFIAYLLGALPYYKFPMSYSFILSLIGLLIGNIINRILK
ncbi:hypothetical protein [Methanothermococcus okinawensis]|uniref:Energy-converting hydrogenase B, subunit J n=1 Tax=Methanothermococcus okinawensis (strain DSM 14208 / JCM 11175 / IH1) TaxID=647113 RepID=F8AJJ6_METOI|nr:hypothetical protein [Methanothermococcus okinawensis]AEH07182.1 hypothetical protein Metok_1214 [Methanothermococcus okinawensis IH1]